MDWATVEFPSLEAVVKVDADSAPGLVESLSVYGLPTLLVFKGGEAVEGSKREGAITKKGLTEYLGKHGVPQREA